MDTLSKILQRFTFQAEVFFSGNLCELTEFDDHDADNKRYKGHLHLLKSGRLTVFDEHGHKTEISQASAILFPQGRKHRLVPDADTGADLVCATIEYGELSKHPISHALPEMLIFSVEQRQDLHRTLSWLFEEAFTEKYGRISMINKLCDIFVLQMLREVLEDSTIQQGLLAGMSHPQLSKALEAMHNLPSRPWQVEDLANIAMMSRAKFASLFTKVVGQTPLDYLTEWRIRLAKDYLTDGDSVHMAATKVGYDSGSALARVFNRKMGVAPKAWLKTLQAD